VVTIVDENARWLVASHGLPKLFIKGDPGAIHTGRLLELVRALPNQREVTVKGLHHLQDDSSKEIGEALRAFVLGKGI
jgi:haloalkane dehalogenase